MQSTQDIPTCIFSIEPGILFKKPLPSTQTSKIKITFGQSINQRSLLYANYQCNQPTGDSHNGTRYSTASVTMYLGIVDFGAYSGAIRRYYNFAV